jgi:hypothetical protein
VNGINICIYGIWQLIKISIWDFGVDIRVAKMIAANCAGFGNLQTSMVLQKQLYCTFENRHDIGEA